MNDKLKVIAIKKILEDEGKVSSEEMIMQIEYLFPEKLKVVTTPPKSSPEQLEYMKNWRLEKKIREEKESEEQRKQDKLNKVLSRKEVRCFFCKEMKKVLNPKLEFRKKRNRTKESIILVSTCPDCGNLIKTFGGFL